mmetsp:Transcript_17316/g.27040  ORF Transcript_17316/g.27040 Transcript_17316/m.27040 type:complete len:202 (+) Transcript_17316:47-652(+)
MTRPIVRVCVIAIAVFCTCRCLCLSRWVHCCLCSTTTTTTTAATALSRSRTCCTRIHCCRLCSRSSCALRLTLSSCRVAERTLSRNAWRCKSPPTTTSTSAFTVVGAIAHVCSCATVTRARTTMHTHSSSVIWRCSKHSCASHAHCSLASFLSFQRLKMSTSICTGPKSALFITHSTRRSMMKPCFRSFSCWCAPLIWFVW